jgi:hypothetical protein
MVCHGHDVHRVPTQGFEVCLGASKAYATVVRHVDVGAEALTLECLTRKRPAQGRGSQWQKAATVRALEMARSTCCHRYAKQELPLPSDYWGTFV